jgi:hypothetical protein
MKAIGDVRLWHKADILIAWANVRYWGQSGHRDFIASCLLLTRCGSRAGRNGVMHNGSFNDVVVYDPRLEGRT